MEADPVRRATLTVPEAAQLLGVGRNTLWALVRRGDIPSVRIGARRVIPRDALDEWVRVQIEENRAAGRRP